MGNKKSIGLPGGPNEYLQDITQFISVDGYRRDSVDKTNPVNLIPSGDISMKNVDFPILGTDNLGNSQMMFPENEYQFPGDMVMEIPQAQFGALGRMVKPYAKKGIKYLEDFFQTTPKEAIYRGVYLNDEIRNSAKFAGKTDDEILEIMGTQIPGGNNTYRKAQFNQTMNFGRNFDEAAEHIRKYTNPNSIFKIGNTDDLINGQKYVLKVNPNPELDFMSAKQQKDLYYETLANFKKANPSSGVVTPNAAKDFNFQNYFDSGRARSFGPDLPIRSEGMNVIDGNFPQFIGNEGSVMGKLLEAIPIKQQAGEISQYNPPGFF